MLKQLSMAAGAGLILALMAGPPAESAPRKADGITKGEATEFSARRRRHRVHRHRHYRYVRPHRHRYVRPHYRYRYVRPYYYDDYPYYAYRPYRYYRPYYRHYYGPTFRIGGPGFYFGFGGW